MLFYDDILSKIILIADIKNQSTAKCDTYWQDIYMKIPATRKLTQIQHQVCVIMEALQY